MACHPKKHVKKQCAELLKTLEEHCKKESGKSFVDLTPAERHDFLVKLEKEAKDYNKKRDDDDKVRKEVHEKDNSQYPIDDRRIFGKVHGAVC